MMLLQTYHQLYVDVLTLLYYNTCTYLCKLSLLQGCTSTKTLSSTAAGNAISFTALVYMTSSEQYTPPKLPNLTEHVSLVILQLAIGSMVRI
jgi:hypothetical protein